MVDQTLQQLTLGERMKAYEDKETKLRFDRTQPVYARIDGRSFSKFTKGMKKPFDEKLSMAMIEVTKYLVKETGATVGYTQSDEISLAWYGSDTRSNIFFDGRIQKMVSNVASIATAKFMVYALEHWGEKCLQKLPTFDCRIINMPNFTEVANMFMWRAMDAYKNSISMAAMAEFSHKQLTGVNGADKIEMMMKKGIDFNALPNFFKYGTFVRNESFFITAKEANIPEQFLNEDNAKGFMRRRVVEVDLGNFVDVANKVAFIFNGAEPEFKIDTAIFV